MADVHAERTHCMGGWVVNERKWRAPLKAVQSRQSVSRSAWQIDLGNTERDSSSEGAFVWVGEKAQPNNENVSVPR